LGPPDACRRAHSIVFFCAHIYRSVTHNVFKTKSFNGEVKRDCSD
jgi:hypothetical protein